MTSNNRNRRPNRVAPDDKKPPKSSKTSKPSKPKKSTGTGARRRRTLPAVVPETQQTANVAVMEEPEDISSESESLDMDDGSVAESHVTDMWVDEEETEEIEEPEPEEEDEFVEPEDEEDEVAEPGRGRGCRARR